MRLVNIGKHALQFAPFTFRKAHRCGTIVIEVGMQNAAQAIAIATSPFIFNSGEMAIPAIMYALFMNVILLLYVFKFKKIK